MADRAKILKTPLKPLKLYIEFFFYQNTEKTTKTKYFGHALIFLKENNLKTCKTKYFGHAMIFFGRKHQKNLKNQNNFFFGSSTFCLKTPKKPKELKKSSSEKIDNLDKDVLINNLKKVNKYPKSKITLIQKLRNKETIKDAIILKEILKRKF